MLFRRLTSVFTTSVVVVGTLGLAAQEQEMVHRRGYKPPPATSHIEVLVVRDVSGKPLVNAAVILRPVKDGRDIGNMELKTGPDGKAMIDVIPVGSVVGSQVIASGYATHGGSFNADKENVSVTIRMKAPKAQYSTYETDGKGLERGAGVREPARTAPTTKVTPKPLSASEPIVKLPAKPADGSAANATSDDKKNK